MENISARRAASTPAGASSITAQFFTGIPSFWAAKRKTRGLGFPCFTSEPLTV